MSEPDAFKISEAVIDLWRCYTIERDMAKELEAENARLKAEVERLTLASQGAVKYVDHTMALTRQSMEHHKQVSRLEAQVERLTKAGDAVYQVLAFRRSDPELTSMVGEQWHKAKEGKDQP